MAQDPALEAELTGLLVRRMVCVIRIVVDPPVDIRSMRVEQSRPQNLEKLPKLEESP